MSIADEIQKLEDLRRDHVLTEKEFQRAKAKLLDQDGQISSLGNRMQRAMDHPDERAWGLWIHLSQFAGLVVPIMGWVVPIVIWQVMKDKSDVMDAHGIHITNWLLSQFIYLIAFGLLSLVIIGIPLFFLVVALGIVFPVMGALKAQNGEVWRYPLSIPFIAPLVIR